MVKLPFLRVSYASAVYGQEEIDAVNEVLAQPQKLSPGVRVKKFEKAISKIYGKTHGIMVNSGSSANLLAVESMNLPVGSEVITPVLTFSTTLTPLLQLGLKPVFVDVVPGAYVIDASKIERNNPKDPRVVDSFSGRKYSGLNTSQEYSKETWAYFCRRFVRHTWCTI